MCECVCVCACACACVLAYTCVVHFHLHRSPFPTFFQCAGTLIVTSPMCSVICPQPITPTHAAVSEDTLGSLLLFSCSNHVCSRPVYDLVHPCEGIQKSVTLHRRRKCWKMRGFWTYSNCRWDYWFEGTFDVLLSLVEEFVVQTVSGCKMLMHDFLEYSSLFILIPRSCYLGNDSPSWGPH